MNKQHTVIVGGTRGIGKEIAREFSSQGHTVSVVGRREPKAEDKKISNVHFWMLDVADQNKIKSTFEEIIRQNGKINNLIFSQRFRGESDPWGGELEVSLTATKNIIESVKVNFNKNDGGAIVIISSIASEYIAEEQPVSYHVGKAGLVQLGRYYAALLGPKGIRVNVISPGTIIKEESKGFYQDNPKLVDMYQSIVPLGRMGTSQDIAQLVSFLCSSKASFITGQNIVVDGGVSLQWHESLARKLAQLNNIKVTR